MFHNFHATFHFVQPNFSVLESRRVPIVTATSGAVTEATVDTVQPQKIK